LRRLHRYLGQGPQLLPNSSLKTGPHQISSSLTISAPIATSAARKNGAGNVPRESFIQARIKPGTIVNADESGARNALHGRFEMKRINHQEAYSLDGACTNWAEEFFSRMRRAEIGHHHHIAGQCLLRYAQESAWREDNRRMSNGEQVGRVAGLAVKARRSVDFTGYWQRHIAG